MPITIYQFTACPLLPLLPATASALKPAAAKPNLPAGRLAGRPAGPREQAASKIKPKLQL